ncbi:MAG: bi-domain-containing oxidoreductase [Bacteroidia bacterium]|nr:bi-domain-containing oxidoreductase [Bacteroidia bacterium]
MEQLTQLLKDGTMQLQQVPMPQPDYGQIVVQNYYSAISIGTEGKTVSDARKGLIGKALSRKQEVHKVLKSAQTLGILTTYKLVMNKLDSPQGLGYSTSGKVIAVGEGVTTIKLGDYVACAGANHAEYVVVNENLAAPLPNANYIKEASLTTLGAIALQGVRQANLHLGENCVVIGLGLIGQLTLQLLRSAGIKAIGVDVDTLCVKRAIENGFEHCYTTNVPALNNTILHLTNGFGTDAVIITASTQSNDPVELAGNIARRKAAVVIVGAVPTGFERANYFKKELELKMSCSYGPGRYESNYEQKGLDYPIEYVRWTENRNMQAFIDLVYTQKINLSIIITHEYKFDNCISAYNDLMSKQITACGVVLKYDVAKQSKVIAVVTTAASNKQNTLIAGVVGAGSFAQNFILPTINGIAKLDTVVTTSPISASNAQLKYKFNTASCNANDVFSNANINTVFVVTRHDSHAKYVMDAIKSNKNVFVEKPLCLHPQELAEIEHLIQLTNYNKMLLVGYNRRFAPLTTQLVKQLNTALPISMYYRVNAGYVPANHWTQDLAVGGGRLHGEVCHFVDYCMYINNSKITAVSATATANHDHVEDSYTIMLSLENGNSATVIYSSLGSKEQAKEYIEVHNAQQSWVLNDYKTLTHFGNKETVTKSPNQNKGHAIELQLFTTALQEGGLAPIPLHELLHISKVMFAIEASILGKGMLIDLD